ncbi:MAG: hypothetical protein NT099_02140 [Candidatus Saganbacteria bacterium]|nr:hypothetical protein [Candidatus Saganbacteria bacterium]
MQKEYRLNKIYLYVLAILTFFVCMWGAIDTLSSGIGLVLAQPNSQPALSQANNLDAASQAVDSSLEGNYQKRMFFERITDSLARFIIGGALFAFFTLKINKLKEE